jgi:DNA-binding transcriptional ArsR family regulator
LFRLLGDRGRLRLLVILADRGEACVGDLAGAAVLPYGNVSNHLMRLRLAGVVATRREGHRVYYRLRSRLAAELLRRVRQSSGTASRCEGRARAGRVVRPRFR